MTAIQTAETNAIAAAPAAFQPVFLPIPSSFNEAKQLATLLATSDFVPECYFDKPANILIAMQWGHELGFKPLQSLQNIACVNGRPTIWGDAAKALVENHPSCEDITETYEGKFGEPSFKAVCTVKRKNRTKTVVEFSIADAQAAQLWGKVDQKGRPTPWVKYPKRMLQLRARGFALRDAFPDVLRGMTTTEEARDTVDMGAAEVVERGNDMPRRETDMAKPGKVEVILPETPAATESQEAPQAEPPTDVQGEIPLDTPAPTPTRRSTTKPQPKAEPEAKPETQTATIASAGKLAYIRKKLAGLGVKELDALKGAALSIPALDAATETEADAILAWIQQQ